MPLNRALLVMNVQRRLVYVDQSLLDCAPHYRTKFHKSMNIGCSKPNRFLPPSMTGNPSRKVIGLPDVEGGQLICGWRHSGKNVNAWKIVPLP